MISPTDTDQIQRLIEALKKQKCRRAESGDPSFLLVAPSEIEAAFNLGKIEKQIELEGLENTFSEREREICGELDSFLSALYSFLGVLAKNSGK